MELSGNLSDFALTDILQILSLSRKTGVLSIEGQEFTGKIILEDGRITHASMFPGESLADRLVRERKISSDVLKQLREQAGKSEGMWGLDGLILESGVMSIEEIEKFARQHTRTMIGKLVAVEKGRFWIDLNQVWVSPSTSEVRVKNGLDVAEVLLQAAKESDDAKRRPSPEVPVAVRNGDYKKPFEVRSILEGEDASVWQTQNGNNNGHREAGSGMLYSLLTELRSHSFEAEVSLLVMRYASEIASRGVLFLVRGDEICGLGQFGFKPKDVGQSVDVEVRNIRVAADETSVLGWVARTGRPYVGVMAEDEWHKKMLSHLGTGAKGFPGFVLPMICNSQPLFLLYGDNFPNAGRLNGVDELVVLVNQASVVLEKIQLERTLDNLSHQVPG